MNVDEWLSHQPLYRLKQLFNQLGVSNILTPEELASYRNAVSMLLDGKVRQVTSISFPLTTSPRSG